SIEPYYSMGNSKIIGAEKRKFSKIKALHTFFFIRIQAFGRALEKNAPNNIVSIHGILNA
ncbi:MAG: hypothetical protein V1764_04015, partial [Nitrospirota bacterium]